VGLVYDPRGLTGVTTARPGVPGMLQMVSESSLAVSQVRTVQLRRIWWRTGQGRGYVRMTHGSSASTERTDVAKRGRSWLGADQRGRRSSKGVDCDILTQALIGLIEYSYHQGIPSFPEVHLQRTPGLSVLGLEQFHDG
jgi:hypothetical protein